jgi:cytochrome P450
MPKSLRDHALHLFGFPTPHALSGRALAHLPGTGPRLLFDQAWLFLSDPYTFSRRRFERYGPLSRAYLPLEPAVVALGREANEAVLRDREQNYSAQHGWEMMLASLFPRGLMLRDGDDHRYQRRLMQPAFRREALALYLERMTPRIEQAVAHWGEIGDFRFYDAIKRLTLDIAAEVFLGIALREEIDQVNEDFSAIVEATIALVRLPVIGRRYGHGLRARARLERFIAERIPARRRQPGSDLFSQLCVLETEAGERYTDAEIVDHLIFVMMAAHDTTTSALTTIVWALAEHPEWQARLREVASGVRGSVPRLDELPQLALFDQVLHEALRLYPPLPVILRRASRDHQLLGQPIPKHAPVYVFPAFSHRDPRCWTEPDRFDPERFGPARDESRKAPFAWVPFGGGAHMCLGLHFAEMQVKAVLVPLLRRWRLSVRPRYVVPWQLAPIAKPRDGLPIVLTRP